MSGIDCPARTVTEENPHKAVVMAINQVLDEKDDYLTELKAGIRKAMSSSNDGIVTEIDMKLEHLQKKLLKKANAKQAFDSIADKIEVL